MKKTQWCFGISLVWVLFFSLPLQASSVKPILETKVLFEKSGKAKVSAKKNKTAPKEQMANQIQTALMFYAYAMNQTPSDQRTTLLNQAQRVVSQVATNAGLKRADILSANPIVKSVKGDHAGQGYELIFGSLAGKGNTLEVKPIQAGAELLNPSVFYLFQDLVTNAPENGLRLMVLAIGGMNKWYREVGKAEDPQSLSQAPAYGLNLAVDIIEKISGKKI